MKCEPSNEYGQTPNLERWLEDHRDYLFRYALVRLLGTEKSQRIWSRKPFGRPTPISTIMMEV